jgi:hypothetical protein
MDIDNPLAAQTFLRQLTAVTNEHMLGLVDITHVDAFTLEIDWWDAPTARVEVQPENGLYGSVWERTRGICRELPSEPLIALGVLLERAGLV